jgi:hypothetical protein
MLTRPLGRPKNRWEDDIRNDMKKLKIKNWTSCIQDRKMWKLYVENFQRMNLQRLKKKEEEEEKKKKKKKSVFTLRTLFYFTRTKLLSVKLSYIFVADIPKKKLL